MRTQSGSFPSLALRCLATVAIVLWGTSVFAQQCTPVAFEGWEDGLPGGWVGSAGSAAVVVSAGGNPGGYLRAEHSGLVGAQTSDPSWTGDLAAADLTTIELDYLYETADLLQPFVRLRQSGATNGWYYFVASIGVNDGLWHHYDVPVNPIWTDQQATAAGWVDVGPPNVSFAETVADVGIVQLSASAQAGTQALGIDNVAFIPCLFADGFEESPTRTN